MAITNGYATLAQFQQRATRPTTGTEPNQTLIEDAINQASRMIDGQTDRVFYSKSITSEKVDAYEMSENGIYMSSDQRVLYFPPPIISITSVTEDSVALVEDTDYYVYKDTGRVVREGAWSTTRKGIVVTCSVGYATTPERVTNICLAIAEAITGLSVRSVVDEDGSQSQIILRSVPRWVWDEITELRRVVVA